ncbi:MAG: ATP-dependent endonuclease [Bacteriovoracaceae bacterium]|nr:ATP-dependent endonuclease [Bacteriovoracaceae bacterium]
MKLKALKIQNFRRLKDVLIEIDEDTSIFVGANNSGKTSAAQILQLFLGESKERFSVYEFNMETWADLSNDKIFDPDHALLGDVKFPKITLDLWFDVEQKDLYRVIDILPKLEWNNVPVGIRLEYAAKDPLKLAQNFSEVFKKAKADSELHPDYQAWPKSLFEYLLKTLRDEFEIKYYTLDFAKFDNSYKQENDYLPTPLGDSQNTGPKIIKSILRVDFLNAQRHLSDLNTSSGAENLSKRFNRFYSRNLQKKDEDIEAIKTLANSEAELTKHFTKVFDATLKSINTLGYPGFSDPQLMIKAVLNTESIMSQNANLYYSIDGAASELPDKYNGLGFKNLIFMILELLDFHSKWIQEDTPCPLHIIVIEEPEAHLHSQLQQVFTRKVFEIISENTPQELNLNNQIIITTHSPHIIYESGFTPIRYFRRSLESGRLPTSEVLNLSTFLKEKDNASTEEKKEFLTTKNFLQQYMKLTHCDLFFADAVILVEGNVERLLLPLMIEKSAPKLKTKYLSILEVGGAFAFKFKELIEFLGSTTLIVTDLDSVKGKKTCMTSDVEAKTSNSTLKKWLPKHEKVSDLLGATPESKIQKRNNSEENLVAVAYQTQTSVNFNNETLTLAGRTLEESFALENLAWCQKEENQDLDLNVETEGKNLSEIAKKIFEVTSDKSFKKTQFALELMGKNVREWVVPNYIQTGLIWLESELTRTNANTEAPNSTGNA